jgi:uncharacterized protein YdaU (DUF1376 family)
MKKKEKAPAFLFYSKDWLQGTAKFMPAEKGVYIDLLSHLHQDDILPDDMLRLARMVGLTIDEFAQIWDVIKTKFVYCVELKGWTNKKLERVLEKQEFVSKRKAIGAHFVNITKSMKIEKDLYIDIRRDFIANDFMDIEDENLKEEINTWISKYSENWYAEN